MVVRVNGVDRQLDEGTTLAELLAELDLDRDGIAVAVERRVVPRSQHPQTVLAEGKQVEIIRAVGGG